MSKFKVGDKIKLIVNVGPSRDDGVKGGVEKGDILTCVDKAEPLEGYRLGNGEVSCEWANKYKSYFKEKKQMFDIKKDKWFIYTPTPEISKIVQVWLFAQGFVWQHFKDAEVHYTDSRYLKLSPFEDNAFCHTDTIDLKYDKSKEIKLTFKTVVDSVEFPETQTPEQIQLDKVMDRIAELQKQASQLQELINK